MDNWENFWERKIQFLFRLSGGGSGRVCVFVCAHFFSDLVNPFFFREKNLHWNSMTKKMCKKQNLNSNSHLNFKSNKQTNKKQWKLVQQNRSNVFACMKSILISISDYYYDHHHHHHQWYYHHNKVLKNRLSKQQKKTIFCCCCCCFFLKINPHIYINGMKFFF